MRLLTISLPVEEKKLIDPVTMPLPLDAAMTLRCTTASPPIDADVAIEVSTMPLPLPANDVAPTLPPNWLPHTRSSVPPDSRRPALVKPPIAMPCNQNWLELAPPKASPVATAPPPARITQRVALSPVACVFATLPGWV